MTLEQRIIRLEKLLLKNEAILNSKRENAEDDAIVAVANWVRNMWNNDPKFSNDAIAYLEGETDSVLHRCLDYLDDIGFVYNNEGADLIADCLEVEITGIIEAIEDETYEAHK